MCTAVLMWLVVFVGACRPYFTVSQFFFIRMYPGRRISLYMFCVFQRTSDHRPDNNSNSAHSVLTYRFLQHHHPAAQQQQQQ